MAYVWLNYATMRRRQTDGAERAKVRLADGETRKWAKNFDNASGKRYGYIVIRVSSAHWQNVSTM